MSVSTLTRTPIRDAESRQGLFAPAAVAGLQLPSSFVMAPMTRAQSPCGIPTPDVAAYYRRRAAGGIGLIVTEGTYVDHPTAGHERAIPRLTAATAQGWARVVDGVHAEGARILSQLWHLGSEREDVDGIRSWTPSAVTDPRRPQSHAMTIADIDSIIAAFARSARQAWEAGFDGVEIHGAHGYLVDEFLWPTTNRRMDCYGGSPRDRARLAAEIVAAIRAVTPGDFVISVRFSQFKERDFGARIAQTPRELGAILKPLADAGAGMLHASTRRFWEAAFADSSLNLAGWAKKLTGLPTVTVGSVALTADSLTGDPRRSLAALTARHASGEFDLVAIGRALLANPTLVRDLSARRYDRVLDYRKDHEDSYW